MATLIALGSAETAERGGLGVVRVAELLGEDKSQASRMLRTLRDTGFVDRDPDTRGYRLGWRLFALAARAGDRRMVEAATPVLLRLVQRLGERVNLSVLRGTEVLTVLSESPPHALQAAGWVGRTVPAYCTSSGRALLFDHSPEELAELFSGTPFRRLGPNTPGEVEKLAERMGVDRTRGYAIVDEEFEPGLVGAAAPVRDFRDRVVAAVNVSAPRFRFGRQLEAAGRLIKEAAEELSRSLGSMTEPSRYRSGGSPRPVAEAR